MALPVLKFAKPTAGVSTSGGVTFAVYAPFGTDPVLSRYPGTTPLKIKDHPLVKALVEVSKRSVHVSALVDLHGDDTWLVEIPAGKPTAMRITSRWKQAMDAPNNLSGFLRHTRAQWPGTALVLAIEGHGAGYLPDLDTSQLTAEGLTGGGTLQWQITDDGATPLLPMGSPLLPKGSPLLPKGSPLLPVNHYPLSTAGLAKALKDGVAGGERIAVIHFNNCFNMSVELLHTVAPYAEFAAGYMNYNFFTAGESYPAAFDKLKQAGSASTQQMALWFAEGNRDLLAVKQHHPTTGGVARLSDLPLVATRVDALAKALVSALRNATTAARPGVVLKVRSALQRAQQYDTGSTFRLDVPDELTDLASLAEAFKTFDVNKIAVQKAANELATALAGFKVYGAKDTPWVDPSQLWDFTGRALAMNILCPDPALRGLWDWRSPYYLQLEPTPVQPQAIAFLKNTAWVEFIIEYHKEVPFRGLLPASIPTYPIFNRKYST
ncbi:MAG TPA: clostripain-related cysteine peptidase [Rubrivivax sp.]